MFDKAMTSCLIENFFFLSILHFFSNSLCSGLLVTASANNAFPTCDHNPRYRINTCVIGIRNR